MDEAALHIAVVDDEAAVLKAIKRLLSSSGLDAMTYPSGQSFLDSLAHRRPDCVVLDLHMPQLGGLDVLRHLSSVGMRLPIVILTAHDEPGAHAQCMAAGAMAYLVKPLDEHTLLSTIRLLSGRA
jgi:FixJ family two-component response regulator